MWVVQQNGLTGGSTHILLFTHKTAQNPVLNVITSFANVIFSDI